MAPKGRKPKPPRLKIIEGNPGQRPINLGLQLPPGAPPEPYWPRVLPGPKAASLRREARAEWRRIVPELDRMGLLAHADRALLLDYCRVTAHLENCEQIIAREGKYLETTIVRKTGDVYTSWQRHPLTTLAKEYRVAINSYRAELGLGPSSRGRLNVPGPDEADDDEREVFGS